MAKPVPSPADDPEEPEKPPLAKPAGQYHHGNLKAALVEAAGIILEAQGLEGLSLRAVARRAGVSQTAPYRHFADREALMAAVALDGFRMLLEDLEVAAVPWGHVPREAVVQLGAAYVRFATQNPGRFRLMFGPDFADRGAHPEMDAATRALGARLGRILDNDALGMALWASIHGLATLLVEGMIDLGADETGARRVDLIPGRAEILLRALLANMADRDG